MGIKFLRHLERTRLLVHLIDGAKLLKEFEKNLDPLEMAHAVIRDKEIIDAELYTFSEDLASKPQILAFNKADLYTEEFLEELKTHLLPELKKKGYGGILFISAAAHQGLEEIVQRMYQGIQQDELDRLKGRIKRALIIQQESSPARAGSIALDWYYLQHVRTKDELQSLIDGLTCESINGWLAAHPPKNLTVVSLGPKPIAIP